jgi:membrane protease YdiL (CAAX protease family)
MFITSKNYFPSKDSKRSILSGALGFAGFACIVASDFAFSKVFRPVAQPNAGTIFKAMSMGRPLATAWIFARSGLLVPVFEEVVFRGFVRDLMKESSSCLSGDSTRAKVARTVASAVVFTVAHLTLKLTLKQNMRMGVPIFVSGLIFAGLAENTDNLWASSIAHSGNNLAILSRLALKALRH